MSYKVSFESTNIVTNAGGTATGFLITDPSFYSTRQLGIVGSTFQFYKIKNFTVTWVPLVGATSGGVARIAYSDNAEVIYKLVTGTYVSADYVLLTQQSGYTKRNQVWQEYSYSCPPALLNRRPKFQYDSTSYTSIEQTDRTSPAAAIFSWTGPASTTIGYLAVDVTVEFMDPVPVTSSPLFSSADSSEEKKKFDNSIEVQWPKE